MQIYAQFLVPNFTSSATSYAKVTARVEHGMQDEQRFLTTLRTAVSDWLKGHPLSRDELPVTLLTLATYVRTLDDDPSVDREADETNPDLQHCLGQQGIRDLTIDLIDEIPACRIWRLETPLVEGIES